MDNKVALPIIIILIVLTTIFAMMYTVKEPETKIIEGEITDADNDGYPDNVDAFPNNPKEWSNQDNDIWGDNSDIWDSGDAGLLFFIYYYSAEVQIDENTAYPDPYFRLCVDEDGDEWDFDIVTGVYNDLSSAPYPFCEFINVRDDFTEIRFTFEVMDQDEYTPDESVDYCRDEKHWEIHIVTVDELPIFIENNGYDDNINGETNCELKYGVAIVSYMEI